MHAWLVKYIRETIAIFFVANYPRDLKMDLNIFDSRVNKNKQ